ncbi:hypothetical protein [uncultured Methanobrevibacter sp.]|uniref:hypothetical protein n=1 Tax=uncultured Methanobrevibacter sp. TaxID=253161 RepID=UPI00260B4F61|nr:hypothetical protein [uncultured Methanobrevibacter sp.]
MIKKRYLAILLIILIVAVYGFVTINQSAHEPQTTVNETQTTTHEFLGNDSTGSVEVIRNVGNPNGERVAYVVGVHPLENDTHKTLLNLLQQQANLNCCYDIYIINVDLDFSQYGQLYPDDEPGRAEGQDLAYKYVYPAIVNGSYKFAVDVHAHGGAYPYDTFVFCPVDGGTGESYGRNVSESTQNVSYYNPYQTTSGPYLTIPLNENGIPAIYFEENSFYSQDIKDSHMMELIRGVDNLKL